MSYRRQKQARKVLEFYSNNFGLKGSPYNVLIDVTFVRAALLHKVDLREQIPGYLGGHAKFFTTTCAVREAEAFGRMLYGPLKIMQTYNCAACPHRSHGIDPIDCLTRMAKWSHGAGIKEGKTDRQQFIVATQHDVMSEKIRRIPGVPLMYLHGTTLVLEKPSEKSKKQAKVVEEAKLVPQHEEDRLSALMEEEGIVLEYDGPVHHKKKLKGPNPFSVLKKMPWLPATKRDRIREKRKWMKVRRRKTPPSAGSLEDLMIIEFALESLAGDYGVIYRRRPIAELRATHQQLDLAEDVGIGGQKAS